MLQSTLGSLKRIGSRWCHVVRIVWDPGGNIKCHKMEQPVGYGQYVPADPLAWPTLLTPGAVLALAHVCGI